MIDLMKYSRTSSDTDDGQWILQSIARPHDNTDVIFRTVNEQQHSGTYIEHYDGYNWVAISDNEEGINYIYFTNEQVKDWTPDKNVDPT